MQYWGITLSSLNCQHNNKAIQLLMHYLQYNAITGVTYNSTIKLQIQHIFI